MTTQKHTDVNITLRKLKQDNVAYLKKMSFAVGPHNFRMKLGLAKKMSEDSKLFELDLVLIKRQDWSSNLKPCEYIDKAYLSYKVPINQNGIVEDKHDGVWYHTFWTTDPQFVMFYLVDCQKVISTMPEHRKGRIEGWIDARNFNDGDFSHFDDSEKGFIQYVFVCAIFYCIFAIMIFRNFLKACKKSEEVNRLYLMVNIALISNALSFPLEFIHLWVFSYNGKGIEFLNFVSQAFNYVSWYILCITIIFIAHGWTINVDSIGDFELFLPVSIMLGIFQIVIIGIGRLIDNNEHF